MAAPREREHALDRIREAVRGLDFPATRDTVRDAAGLARVPLPGGDTVRMEMLLDRVREHDFGSREAFEIEAGRAWERLADEVPRAGRAERERFHEGVPRE